MRRPGRGPQTGSPMTRNPSQTEDLTVCTGNPVSTIESGDADIGLETKKNAIFFLPVQSHLKRKWMRDCELY